MVQETTNKELKSNLKLSIQVRLDGLSFCILDPESGNISWYRKVSFSKEHNPGKALEEIEALYQKEEILNDTFNEVSLLFSNELYSIVPSQYFIEDEASTYLKFNTKILGTDVVESDQINKELVNVYIPYTNITNYFFDRYGEFEFRHSASELIKAALELSNANETLVLLNNFTGYYDLVIVKEGALLFCNTFNYESREDFIYYLLFTAEQLDLDPAEFNLKLLGNITAEMEEFNIAYTYIKNIAILEPGFLKLQDIYNQKFQREEFLLLRSLGCE